MLPITIIFWLSHMSTHLRSPILKKEWYTVRMINFFLPTKILYTLKTMWNSKQIIMQYLQPLVTTVVNNLSATSSN